MSIINSLPEGSYSENVDSSYGMQIWEEELDSLQNGESTVELMYENSANTEFADVKLYLGPINITDASSKISIVSEDEAYEHALPLGYSGKVVFFSKIPSAFLEKFVVKNDCGIDFFNSDNLITVTPIYILAE